MNVLVGSNGQGKTNVLEAVQYLALGRSHRGSRDEEIVRFGGGSLLRARGGAEGRGGSLRDRGRIRAAAIQAPQGGCSTGCAPHGSRRRVGVRVVRSRGQRAGARRPAARGGATSTTRSRRRVRRASNSSSDYRRAVQQRTALLRDECRLGRGLEVWDAEVVRLGHQVVARRVDALADLAPRASRRSRRLATGAADDDCVPRAGPGSAASTSKREWNRCKRCWRTANSTRSSRRACASAVPPRSPGSQSSGRTAPRRRGAADRRARPAAVRIAGPESRRGGGAEDRAGRLHPRAPRRSPGRGARRRVRGAGRRACGDAVVAGVRTPPDVLGGAAPQRCRGWDAATPCSKFGPAASNAPRETEKTMRRSAAVPGVLESVGPLIRQTPAAPRSRSACSRSTARSKPGPKSSARRSRPNRARSRSARACCSWTSIRTCGCRNSDSCGTSIVERLNARLGAPLVRKIVLSMERSPARGSGRRGRREGEEPA